MESYNIRKAVFEDLEEICQLLSESFIETKEPIRYWWRIMENTSIHTYVVEREGNKVGKATLNVLEKTNISNGSSISNISQYC